MQNSSGRSVHIVVIILKKIGFLIKFKRIKKKQLPPLDIPFAVQLRCHPGVLISCTIIAVQKTHKNSRLYILYTAKK